MIFGFMSVLEIGLIDTAIAHFLTAVFFQLLAKPGSTKFSR